MFDVFRAKLENDRVKLPDELASAGEKLWMVYEWKVGKKHFFKCIILNGENYEEFLASEKNSISDMEITSEGKLEAFDNIWHVPLSIRNKLETDELVFVEKADFVEIMNPAEYESYREFIKKISEAIRKASRTYGCIIRVADENSNCFTMRSNRAATEYPVWGPRGLQRGKGNS